MINWQFQSQALIFFPMQEFLVKNADRVELMAMLGLFGAIVSAIQMYPWFQSCADSYMRVISSFYFSELL